jgi:hypothetical protein
MKGFTKIDLEIEENLFGPLLEASPPLDSVTKGRQGGVIVKPLPSGEVPLVRTTTAYDSPPLVFQPLHDRIVSLLGAVTGQASFNNGLFEVYTDAYPSMGWHSDQAQDLADPSHIAVVSFYRYPERGGFRSLVVKPKDGTRDCRTEETAIEMSHGSAVLFSTETNRKHKHQIVLSEPRDNVWLGITFRTSKTFVDFSDPSRPTLNSIPLRLVDSPTDYYKTRGQENHSIDFVWPPLDFTLSPSDLIYPTNK